MTRDIVLNLATIVSLTGLANGKVIDKAQRLPLSMTRRFWPPDLGKLRGQYRCQH